MDDRQGTMDNRHRTKRRTMYDLPLCGTSLRERESLCYLLESLSSRVSLRKRERKVRERYGSAREKEEETATTCCPPKKSDRRWSDIFKSGQMKKIFSDLGESAGNGGKNGRRGWWD